MTYLLGIDSSTTATKAVLVDEHGKTVGVASSTYGLSTPKPLWAEQDPRLWWRAARAASLRCRSSSSAGVHSSGAMAAISLVSAYALVS